MLVEEQQASSTSNLHGKEFTTNDHPLEQKKGRENLLDM
jgi:hypothetical protein